MGSKEAAGQRIRVLIVDDHPAMREGTKHILEEGDGFEIVGEAGDGPAAIDLASRLLPDVILMDIKIPGMNGIEATRKIKRTFPKISVLALTGYDGDQYIRAMFKAGAVGYLLKSASGEEITAAVRTASLGGKVLSADLAEKVADYLHS